MKQFLTGYLILVGICGLVLGPTSWSLAGPQSESMCTIGMVKGEKGRTCEVPIPDGCTIAKIPGHDEPWADISKGGGTQCQFDEQKTDWTTKITGSCGPCTTDNCSAQFRAKFNCSAGMDFTPQKRKKH